MLKCVCISEELAVECFCNGGILLINASLSNKKILEIIESHLDLKQDNHLNSEK